MNMIDTIREQQIGFQRLRQKYPKPPSYFESPPAQGTPPVILENPLPPQLSTFEVDVNPPARAGGGRNYVLVSDFPMSGYILTEQYNLTLWISYYNVRFCHQSLIFYRLNMKETQK